ncbi:N-acyl-L-homoserine lactone (AHL) synthase [Rhizobium sp. CFBP 8762]|uniref:acyl-homoserine-lactone synthase n=1 Tax=Rhizobium sp. CFBP 8762 TaxID=2775279 RepID=UPI0017807725|nr:acyl-homoserine-lactone synthase [Rhizobium sp. CFBP 8762]MBD8555579.1 N-acyl-L-homoserine lactone (AHL) synthase [Rhizobium sp. CFBP 8762]
MYVIVQKHEYQRYSKTLDQFFRLRKLVFCDKLGWNVPVINSYERDTYDELDPAYLLWCDDSCTKLYGGMRLMPTTGPTLLYDVFRQTFPEAVDLVEPGIWEGTRMCVDEDALARDLPEVEPGRAFSLLLLALCECAMAHGIHTMISNYEPHMRRLYKRAGVFVDELGRADLYGKYPVCCGAFEVSEMVLSNMRSALNVDRPLYQTAFSQISANQFEAA